MKRWNKVVIKSIRLTNLELLLGVLTCILMLYLGMILPYYIEQMKHLQQVRNTYVEMIQALKMYKLREEEWVEWDEWLNLCLAGYRLDFPEQVDEYVLLGKVEDYLVEKGVMDLEVTFVEIKEELPFKNYIYKVRYVSDERITKDIVYQLPREMEGIRMQEMGMKRLSTGEYATEYLLDIRCK